MGFDPDKLPESFKRCMAADPVTVRHAIMDKMNTDSATAKREEICEREIQEQIRQYLRLRDIYVVHQPMNKRSQLEPGTPDFLFAFQSVPIAMEAKTLTGKLSEEQTSISDRLRANGWKFHVVHGVEDVKSILDKIDVNTR